MAAATAPSTPSSRTTLSAPGPRIVVSESEARVILSAWTAQLNSLSGTGGTATAITTLDLSCRSWTVPALLILEPALRRIAPTVTHLKLDDIIASLPTADGFATLGFFNRIFGPDSAPNVTRVDLSDNALGARSLDVIPNLLENAPQLRHLRLHNCGMSLEVAAQLSARLGGEVAGTTRSSASGEEDNGGDSPESTSASASANAGIADQLQSLYLGRNNMEPEGAVSFGRLLAKCRSLRHLSYAGSRAFGPGTRALLDGLVTMAASCPDGLTSLIELDFNDCSFGTGADVDVDALGPLCAMIRSSCPHLVKLVLKDGGLGPSGFDLLVEALVAGGCRLRYLDVGCLDLEEDGAAALATYIGHHLTDTLEELHLETNLIKDGGLQTLLPVLAKCTRLTVLNLTENGLEEGGHRALATIQIPGLRKLLMKENCEEDVEDGVKDAIRGLYPVVLMADDDEEDATGVRASVGLDAAFGKTWKGVEYVPVDQRTAVHLAQFFMAVDGGGAFTFDSSLVDEIMDWSKDGVCEWFVKTVIGAAIDEDEEEKKEEGKEEEEEEEKEEGGVDGDVDDVGACVAKIDLGGNSTTPTSALRKEGRKGKKYSTRKTPVMSVTWEGKSDSGEADGDEGFNDDGNLTLGHFEREIAKVQAINLCRYPRVEVVQGARTGSKGYATHVTSLRVAVQLDGNHKVSYYKPDKIEIVD